LKTTKIIGVSAIGEQMFRTKEGSNQFDGFYSKPIHIETLRMLLLQRED